MSKKLKGGTLRSRPALYVMRETFWFCSLGPQVKFGRTILVTSGGLERTLMKSHDYSRLLSLEKCRLKKTTENDEIQLTFVGPTVLLRPPGIPSSLIAETTFLMTFSCANYSKKSFFATVHCGNGTLIFLGVHGFRR